MIKWNVLGRLAVPLAAATLLLLCLAYWWQSNLVHELAGTAIFLLVAQHLFKNRRWLFNLQNGRYDGRRRAVVVLHAALALNMLMLLVTSVAVSQTLFAGLGIPGSVTVRDLHWVAAYWLMMTVGVHLGLHWSRVMAMLRSALRIQEPNRWRTLALRISAVAMAVFGAWSWSLLEVGTKLSWGYSISFWDFGNSVAPFFAHWLGVLTLPAVGTYYAFSLATRGK